MLHKELSLLENGLMHSELTNGIRQNICSGKWFLVYFDSGNCCSLFLVMFFASLATCNFFFLYLLNYFLLALRSRMVPCLSPHQHHRSEAYERRGANMFLAANMLSCLAFFFWCLLSTTLVPWRPNKETTLSGLLSAYPPFSQVRDIVNSCMWTVVFHSHLWICPIPIGVIGFDLKLFPIPFVAAAGKAAVLLMDFVGSKFDSLLTTKASSLLKQYNLYI